MMSVSGMEEGAGSPWASNNPSARVFEGPQQPSGQSPYNDPLHPFMTNDMPSLLNKNNELPYTSRGYSARDSHPQVKVALEVIGLLACPTYNIVINNLN
ncbi:hypothetical protein LSAT2_011848 [Lamellibrachia satsuma]|nr:hypothetical protein LSAT2_011848 [Lamellibrachia satsuma]